MLGTSPLVAPPTVAKLEQHEDVEKDERHRSPESETRSTTITTTRSVPPVTSKQVSKAFLPALVLLIAIFWINLSQLYGLFYNQGKWTKRARVALVDFDGAAMGQSVFTVAAGLNQTYAFPTYAIVDPTQTSPDEIRHDVFSGKYWAAIYVASGATERWQAAVNGTSTTAYNPSDTLFYVTLTQRYYAFYESNLYASTLTVVEGAVAFFSQQTASAALGTSTTTTAVQSSGDAAAAARAAIVTPIVPVQVFAAFRDFTDDIKALLNTIGAVMPILMQFFFLMAWNGIGNSLHMYAASSRRTHVLYRLFWSFSWPVISGLCSAGWSFTFKRDYPLGGKEFVALWAITALYAAISFDVLDIVTTYIPIGFVPFFFLTWIIFNVSAALGDPQILNQWYRINYFFPALHWWQTCITIYTKGGVNRLHYTLPTLFAWLVIVKAVSIVAILSRVRLARLAFSANPTTSVGH